MIKHKYTRSGWFNTQNEAYEHGRMVGAKGINYPAADPTSAFRAGNIIGYNEYTLTRLLKGKKI